MPQKELMSWNTKSTRSSKAARYQLQTLEKGNDKSTKLRKKLEIIKQMPKKSKASGLLFDFKANISNDDNLLVSYKGDFTNS